MTTTGGDEASAASRRIRIPGTTNLRDIGGLPVADGAHIAAGRLFRGEVIASTHSGGIHGWWDPEAVDQFRALGLQTVIDLRASREVAATESAWSRATGADVVLLPIEEGGEGTDTNYMRQLLDKRLARFGEADLTRFYCEILDRRAATFAAAVRVLAEPGRLPALAHCSAGKDRTGLLVALVLEVLGTPRQVVVDDYALTGVLRPDRVQVYAEMLTDAGVELDAARVLFETPPAAMLGALQHLDTAFGGAAGYLREAGGSTADELDALRCNLLE